MDVGGKVLRLGSFSLSDRRTHSFPRLCNCPSCTIFWLKSRHAPLRRACLRSAVAQYQHAGLPGRDDRPGRGPGGGEGGRDPAGRPGGEEWAGVGGAEPEAPGRKQGGGREGRELHAAGGDGCEGGGGRRDSGFLPPRSSCSQSTLSLLPPTSSSSRTWLLSAPPSPP